MVLSPFKTKNGYMKINILRKGFYVHRLVAESFIPNPDNKPQVNHKNCDKTDNRADNLEWATNSENVRHYNASHKKKSKKVRVIEVKSGKVFESVAEAARFFGINSDTIYKSIREKRSIINGRCFVPIPDIDTGL